MVWDTVIGLEVHVQLATKTKLFSGAATAFGAEPNTQACAIDLALPGVLPVLNEAAVTMAIKLGLSIHATIAKHSVFARKNYFYPDLPKGYQISQYELPIVEKGYLDIPLESGEIKRVGIIRAHLEEDAGKSLHENFTGYSGIDLNRAGTPLLEIVSEPVMYSAKEAVLYLKALHALVCYLEICDGNLQEGSFRCDANVSVRPQGTTKLGTRAEIKNLNSFRFIERAIQYESARQISILESGGTIVQETRLYNSDLHETRAMRSKEDAHDYRYFPDPDLLPLSVTEAEITAISATLPELPQQKSTRFQTQYELSSYDANVLSSTRALADYFEQTVAMAKSNPKLVANWVTGELAASLNKANLEITASPVTALQLAGLLARITDNTISGKMAKTVFEALWQGTKSADEAIAQLGLKKISDESTLTTLINQIIEKNPTQVADYRAGKTKLFAFFVGQVMQQTKGQADPARVNQLLKEMLG